MTADIEGSFTMELFDVVGKQVNSIKITENSIDVSQLPIGLYVLKLNFENGSIAKRLAIQR